jgi:hypothetical protein
LTAEFPEMTTSTRGAGFEHFNSITAGSEKRQFTPTRERETHTCQHLPEKSHFSKPLPSLPVAILASVSTLGVYASTPSTGVEKTADQPSL